MAVRLLEIILLSAHWLLSYAYVPPAPKLITFWGQNSAFKTVGRTEKSLALMCNDKSPYQTIVIGYVSRFFDERNKDSLPGMGFSFHCTKGTDESHPALLYCPRIANDIRFCHEHERKILIGIGGPNAPSKFESPNHAEKFAKTIWHLFLDGDDMPDLRPFGSVKLDGINLYMDDQDSQYVDIFLQTLHSLRKTVTDRNYLLTVSPSCMFPDPYFGPGPKTVLDSSINIIDQIYIRYTDKGCCVKGSASFRNSLSKWKNFMSMPRGAEFYFALPAAPEATSIESCYRTPQQMEAVYNSLKWRRRFRGFCILDNSYDLKERDVGFTYSNNMLYYILPKRIRIKYVPVPYVIKVPVVVPTQTPSSPGTRPSTELPPVTTSTTETPATDPPITDPPSTTPPPTEPPETTTVRTTVARTTPVNVPSTQAPEPTTPAIVATTSKPTPVSSTPIEEQKNTSDDLMEINGGNNVAQNNDESEEQDEEVEDNEDGGNKAEEEEEEEENKEDTQPDLVHPTPSKTTSQRPSPAQAAEEDENPNVSNEDETTDEDEDTEEGDEDESRPDPKPIVDDKFSRKKLKMKKMKAKKFHKLAHTAKHHKHESVDKIEDEKIERHSYRHEINPQDPPGLMGGDLHLNTNNNENSKSFWNMWPYINNGYSKNKPGQHLTEWLNKGLHLQSEEGSTSEEEKEEYIFEDSTNKQKKKKNDDDDDEFSASGSADDEDYVDFYPYKKTKGDIIGTKKQNELKVPNVSNPYDKPNPPMRHEDQFDENRKYLDMLQEGMQQQSDKFNQDIISQQPMDPNKVDQTKQYPYPVPDKELQKLTPINVFFNNGPLGYDQVYPRDLASNLNLKGNMDQLKSLMESMQQNVDTANEAMQDKQLNDQREINEQERKKGSGKNRKNFFEEILDDFNL